MYAGYSVAMMNEPDSYPTLDDVRAAARRIGDHVHRTPVIRSPSLDRRCGAEVFLKCENLQRTGAFKFRGALNAMMRLTAEEKRRGVLTYSSGNHAAALARAGRILNVAVTAVMPLDAPAVKLAATRGYGASVVLYDPREATRESVGEELRERNGSVLIPPFDHPDIIAGQGTAALELIEVAGVVDTILVPCGGGGLLSGSAVTAKGLLPGCRVVGVEPEVADDAARSFSTGTLQRVKNPPTVADGLRTASLGTLTFPMIRARVDEFRTVSESEIVSSLQFLWTRTKLVVEASGAVAAAPLVAGEADPVWGGRIGVIVSGGNIDLATVAEFFSGE